MAGLGGFGHSPTLAGKAWLRRKRTFPPSPRNGNVRPRSRRSAEILITGTHCRSRCRDGNGLAQQRAGRTSGAATGYTGSTARSMRVKRPGEGQNMADITALPVEERLLDLLQELRIAQVHIVARERR